MRAMNRVLQWYVWRVQIQFGTCSFLRLCTKHPHAPRGPQRARAPGLARSADAARRSARTSSMGCSLRFGRSACVFARGANN